MGAYEVYQFPDINPPSTIPLLAGVDQMVLIPIISRQDFDQARSIALWEERRLAIDRLSSTTRGTLLVGKRDTICAEQVVTQGTVGVDLPEGGLKTGQVGCRARAHGSVVEAYVLGENLVEGREGLLIIENGKVGVELLDVEDVFSRGMR